MKFLRYFVTVTLYVLMASALLGLGIVGTTLYIPNVVCAETVLDIVSYAILIGAPFIMCFVILFSFVRVIKRLDEIVEETPIKDRKTKAERRLRKIYKKLAKEGVTIVW